MFCFFLYSFTKFVSQQVSNHIRSLSNLIKAYSNVVYPFLYYPGVADVLLYNLLCKVFFFIHIIILQKKQDLLQQHVWIVFFVRFNFWLFFPIIKTIPRRSRRLAVGRGKRSIVVITYRAITFPLPPPNLHIYIEIWYATSKNTHTTIFLYIK